ncbi:ABC transporter permease [Lacibacter sp. H407]|uniref:ABC transporter permease n=1 Tax=Lacibacter sp. H407 TaxID=3133423 RepID=UPI0030C36227
MVTYLKIAYRNLFKNRLYSLINLVGLTIGIISCLLISIYVKDELTYDRFNQKADRIVLLQQFENNWASGGKLATDMKANFSQVEKAVRLKNVNPLIKFADNAYYEPDFYFSDSTVFDVFTFPLLKGNAATALKEKYGVVISETIAQKYFPGIDPIGKELRYDNKYSLHVTGVMKDLPNNAHLKIDFLAGYSIANELVGWDVTNNYWGGGVWTYLLLTPGSNTKAIESQFPGYVKKLNDPNASFVWKMKLIPLADIYLKTSLIASSPITYVYVFSVIGLFILALACFNFINLATARAGLRSREVGVRKVLGSSLTQLRLQFILEAAMFVFLALLVALTVLQFCMPAFNSLLDKKYSLLSILNTENVLYLCAGFILVSLIAGAYPAFILSSYKPVTVLKGELVTGKGKYWLRKSLVVIQFSVSMIMIAATLITYQQLNYVKNKNLGYQRSQILTLDLRDAPANTKEIFKQEVKKIASVEMATRAYGLPGSGLAQGQKLVSDYVPADAKDASIMRLTIDEDYLSTFNIKLTEGRMLNSALPADKQSFLINESAKKYFKWKNINGKATGYYTFQYKTDGSYKEIPVTGEVVGVIADYNHADLKTEVAPMIFSLNDGWEGQMAIKLKAGNISLGIEKIKALWQKFFPDKPFEYNFLDTVFDQTYKSENKTARLFSLFAGLAILISCMGLLGLVAHVSNVRKKEIGVRKVLGASVSGIIQLLGKEFIVLIIIAWVIAFPLAWWAMSKWLQNFAYRITMDGWVFMAAGLAAFAIALLSISFQAIKAAVANPVKSLRTE